MDLFSEDVRRNPYPAYEHFRSNSPLLYEPRSGLYLLFDYEGVKRVLSDAATFSSRYGPDWMIFTDPPRHTKLRSLIMRAFTPRGIAELEPRIRELSRKLLDEVIERGEMDMAMDFSVPLPMTVISEMLGIPAEDWPKFAHWSEVILNMSHTVARGERSEAVTNDFVAVTAEMNDYLGKLSEERRSKPRQDLLGRLLDAELDGERLSPTEILGFFQLLLVGGQETTTNLINNAILCFLEYPDALAKVRENPAVLPSSIEEILRYRSPVQWMFRGALRDVELHGQTVPKGKRVLVMLGSANRDPKQFNDPDHFDIMRDPNPHIAFGHGIHFCLGAALSRLEARIALSEFLARVEKFELATSDPWEPRKALHVHGPVKLPLRFIPGKASSTAV